MLLESLTVAPSEFAGQTGWTSRPEGLCKGDRCVPAPEAVIDDDTLSVPVLSERLGMPLVSDDEHGVHALGPEATGRALTTAVVPEIVLRDLDGNPFALSSLHGRKVLLVAWASW